MLKIDIAGKNLSVKWETPDERRRLEKIPDKAPIYCIDEDGDSVIDHIEYPKHNLRLILDQFSDIEYTGKAQDLITSYEVETTSWKTLDSVNGEFEFPISPKDYQERYIRLSDLKPNMILNLGIGAGKSLASSYRTLVLNKGVNTHKILIIAPKKLVTTSKWKNEIKDCLGRDCFNFWASTPKKRAKLLEQIKDQEIVATTYEQAGYLEGFDFEYLIIDEGQLIRNERTKRYKNVKKHVNTKPKSIQILTGTPSPNKLEKFWTLLKLIAPNLAGSKPNFLKRFQKATRFKKMSITLPSGVEFCYKKAIDFMEINLDELNQMVEPVVYTVPKEDIIDFEDCLEYVDLDMLPKQHKAYNLLAEEMLEKRENNELEEGEGLTYLLRLRQIAEGLHLLPEYNSQESNKLEYVYETINELDDDEQLILWSIFQKGTNLIKEKYPKKTVLFNGSISENLVRLGILAFNGISNEDELQEYYKLANKQHSWPFSEPGTAQLLAGVINELSAIGLDFHKRGCYKQIVISPSDLWDHDLQATGRISRLGQKSNYVLTEYLHSNGTADKKRTLKKLEKGKNRALIFNGYGRAYSKIDDMIQDIQDSLI